MLHVNSNMEKGATRGPPRNKMALCEEVNTPSQRFSSESMSVRLLSSSNSTDLFPLASVSHGHCQKVDGFSLFCSSLEHSHMAGRFHSNYLGPKYRECRTSKSGNYKARQSLRTTTEYKWHHPFGFYNSVNISDKEDDFRNPCFGIRGKIMNTRIIKQEVKKAGAQHQTAFEKQDGIERIYVTSREHPRDDAEYSSKVSGMSDEKAEMLCPVPSADEKISADTGLGVWAIYRTHESGDRSFVPLSHQKRSFVNCLSKLSVNCEQMHQECRNLPSETACVEIVSGDPVRISRKRSSSAMEKPSCSGRLAGENNRMQHGVESINKSPKENDCESSRVEEEVKRSSAISDVSVVDSTSRLGISPDDVLRLMGPEVFWQVRRTIAHQQRVFTAQIFELHRLLKVQKLIAKSPEMLPEGDLIFSKPVNSLTENKLQLELFPEPPAVFLKTKDDPAKPKPFPDYAAEEAQKNLPPTGDINPNSALKPYSGAPTATSCAPEEAKFGPLCIRVPSGYQWLVPVRSPSEGLIYKPCTGPYPPTAGSIAPIYGGYDTMSLSRKDAPYVNNAFGVPASKQGIVIYSGPDTLGNSCCQTNSPAPEINTYNPNSAVLQDNRLPTNDINCIIPYQSSYNVSQGSGIMTDSDRNLLVSKCSDLLGSIASSPGERVQGDELPLFPITTVDCQKSQRKIQVIKVVPHNPKSASESAARIFQSIQEERKQD